MTAARDFPVRADNQPGGDMPKEPSPEGISNSQGTLSRTLVAKDERSEASYGA